MTNKDFMGYLKKVLKSTDKDGGYKLYQSQELIEILEEENMGVEDTTDRVHLLNDLDTEVLCLILFKKNNSNFPQFFNNKKVKGYSPYTNPDAILFIPYKEGIIILVIELKSGIYNEEKVRKQIRSGAAMVRYIHEVVIYLSDHFFDNIDLRGLGFKFPTPNPQTPYFDESDEQQHILPEDTIPIRNEFIELDTINKALYLYPNPLLSYDLNKINTPKIHLLSELLTIKAS